MIENLAPWLQWVIVFAALFFTDVFWAFYIKNVQINDPHRSAAWAVLLFAAGAIAVVGYAHNYLLILPAMAGAYAGTYLAVWWDKRKK